MIDPIDDFVIPQLMEYKGKKLKAINKGESSAKEKSEDEKKVFEGYVGYAKELLDGVKEVKITSRLNESAAVLVGDEFSASPHIEEMMKKMGQPVPERESILEINPDNKLVQQAKSLFEKNKDDDKAKNLTYLIHEQAIIASGAKLKDPSSFINRLNKLLSED
jgi:molecular chaperone HtpG